MDDDADIKVTPAQRAYLAAFDHWLKHTWATGKAGRMHDGATAVKDACFDAMTAERGMAIPFYRDGRRDRPKGPICRECGQPFTRLTNIGRPRVKCYECQPARLKVAA